MRIAKFIGAASVAALVTFDSGATLAQGTDLVTVTVVGSGANEAEARLDAIRQATQQVASQVVVAERLIADDEVVYDNVMSTMNGFVHDFTELSVKKSETEVQIEAEIVVSGSLMRDFASGQANSVSVDGGGMFGELLRSKSQAEVHQKMFESIWRRHTDGIDAEIALKDYDAENVTFDITFKWSDEFLASIRSFLSQASYGVCRVEGSWRLIDEVYAAVDRGLCELKDMTAEDAAERMRQAEKMLNSENELFGAPDVGFYTACFRNSTSDVSCFVLDYLTVSPLISKQMDIYTEKEEQMFSLPQPIKIFGYGGTYGEPTTIENSDGQPSKIYHGISPFALESDIATVNKENYELQSFRIAIPIKYFLGVNLIDAREAYWDRTMILNDASFQVKIPISLIPLQEVKSVKISVVSN